MSRAFPSWNRSMLTEIYLCHACSCQEILRTKRPGRGAVSIGMDAMRQSSAGLRWYPLIHVERVHDSGTGTYRGRATQCGAVRMAWQWRPAPEAAEQRWHAVARCGVRCVLSGGRFD